jgi:hypothetical protein
MTAIVRKSNMATASLALSCASVVLGPFGFIPGIILGVLALKEIDRTAGMSGRGAAIAGVLIGITLGVIFTLLTIAVLTAKGPNQFIYEVK